MRRTWTQLALIACAMQAMPLSAQSSMRAPPPTAEPRAELRSNAFGDPQIAIFKPSYVAVFEVVPYGGIAQLYPLSAAEGAQLVKDAQLTLSASRTREARRASARGVRLVSSGMGTSATRGGRAHASELRPRSMVLIASDQPIRVSSPDVTMGQLAQQMTGLRVPRVFVGEDEDIAKLVARVRPVGQDADVTVDILALPPDGADVSLLERSSSDVGLAEATARSICDGATVRLIAARHAPAYAPDYALADARAVQKLRRTILIAQSQSGLFHRPHIT